MKPQLVSFKLCPFVQRSVIVLLEKGVDFDITYIHLEHPPAWFQAISPLGKVPLLRVGDTTLFESIVIMEYLDEVHPPSLHPTDPLQKALNRAWQEVASSLFFAQYQLSIANTEKDFESSLDRLRDELGRVEGQLVGPYFNGEDFQLIDAAFAPFFTRNALLESWRPLGLLDELPKLTTWQDKLLKRPSINGSVSGDFEALYRKSIGEHGEYSARFFGIEN